MNFGDSSTKLKIEYLDVYEGIYAEIVSSNRFDEDTDLSTTIFRTGRYRFEIARLLQNKTRSPAAKPQLYVPL